MTFLHEGENGMNALLRLIGHSFLFFFLTGCAYVSPTLSPTPEPTPTSIPTSTVETDLAETLQMGLWHDMVYFEETEQVILVNGGPESGKNPEDPVELWTWDGSDWSLVDAEGPRWRNFSSLAYDSNRNVLVLYGGLQAEETFQDTWEWNGEDWELITVEGPGPREAAGMAYDAGRGNVVLFGGAQNGVMMNDTWEWDGREWIQSSLEGPDARFPAGFVYDEVNQNLVLFGGHKYDDTGFIIYGDTWAWNGTSWEFITSDGPTERDGARAVFDPLAQNVFLFGGAEITTNVRNMNDTWIWDGTRWKEVQNAMAPLARVHPAMAFDMKRGVIVMTGGSNGPGSILGDTWEWDGTDWTCMDGCK
jgi:hypothetical protein